MTPTIISYNDISHRHEEAKIHHLNLELYYVYTYPHFNFCMCNRPIAIEIQLGSEA